MRPERYVQRAVVAATLVSAFGLAVASLCLAVGAGPASSDPQTKTVSYHGYTVEVPSSWAVYDLADEPERCVRFDQHAVYLGSPGSNQDCPQRVLGKVEALLIEPFDSSRQGHADADVVYAAPGSATPPQLPDATDRDVELVVESASVVVTATYGESPRGIERILDTATLTSDASAPAVPTPTTASDDAGSAPTPLAEDTVASAVVGGAKWAGEGFDACSAPSADAMQAWMTDSPFGAANIYIGGATRACDQPNLTPEWIDNVRTQGWALIPTYVGLQAPCTDFPNLIDPGQADAQGRAAADDAAAVAAGLGLGETSPIYFDMEGYDSSIAGCTDAVMTFLSAWTVRLHELGYTSGVYSSSSSGIVDIVNNAGAITSPDDIWFANWDERDTIWGDPYFSDDAFADRQRIHQYLGDHDETWGGVTINIDSNALDADVAGEGGGGTSRVYVDTYADAPGLDQPGGAQTGTLFEGTNYVYCRAWGPEVREGDSYNHWWLLTDLDVGPARQWVSAFWLAKWGNDEAKDNNGNEIPDC